MYPNFIKHIRSYVALSDEQAALLLEHVRALELNKNEMLLREGQICRANYFVEQGGAVHVLHQ